MTDKDGGTGTRTASLVVNNVAPVLDGQRRAPATIIEGGSTTITATATDAAGAADPLTYWFDCTGDGRWDFGPQSENTAICAYADNGTFDVQVNVDDGDGGWASDYGHHRREQRCAGTLHRHVAANRRSSAAGTSTPTAEFTDAGVRDFLRTSTMDVNPADTDLPPTPATCTVDYGDGTPVQTLPVHGMTCYGLDHRYMAAGFYTVIVEVTDKDGGIGHAETVYEVINTPPIIVHFRWIWPERTTTKAPRSGRWRTSPTPTTATSIRARSTTATAPADEAGTVTGDPINGYTCTGPAHVYADNTTPPETGYVVTVTVTDEYGISDEETMTHVVAERDAGRGPADTGDDRRGQPVHAGRLLHRSGRGLLERHGRLRRRFGRADAHPGAGQDLQPRSHLRGRRRLHGESLREGRRAEQRSARSATVTVPNVAPVLSDVAATNIDENGTTHLTGTITDPGVLDTFTLVVDWGEGAPQTFTYEAGTTSFDVTHQYLDDNPTGTACRRLHGRPDRHRRRHRRGHGQHDPDRHERSAGAERRGRDHVDENGTTHLTGTITDPGTPGHLHAGRGLGRGRAGDVQPARRVATSFDVTHQYLDDNPTGTAV